MLNFFTNIEQASTCNNIFQLIFNSTDYNEDLCVHNFWLKFYFLTYFKYVLLSFEIGTERYKNLFRIKTKPFFKKLWALFCRDFALNMRQSFKGITLGIFRMRAQAVYNGYISDFKMANSQSLYTSS